VDCPAIMDEVSDGGNVELLHDICTEDASITPPAPVFRTESSRSRSFMRSVHESQGDRHWTAQRYPAGDDVVVVYGVPGVGRTPRCTHGGCFHARDDGRVE
jgi:hypothetical protein